MAKEKTNIDQNADENAPNETSQKFDRGDLDKRHPRADDESLKASDHYVSLKKIKDFDKDNGVAPHKTEKGATTGGAVSDKSGKSEKKSKPEKSLNDKKRPEPTPDLESKDKAREE